MNEYPLDAKKEVFEIVTVLGKRMLFSCARVNRETVPEGFYMYEVRHDDNQKGEPVQIANRILVNYWGFIITDSKIELIKSAANGNGYLDIDPKTDWNYEGYSSTIDEFLKENHCE